MEITRDEATGKPIRIRMRKPSDMHQHLRDDAMLKLVAPMVAKRFRTAIVMPNLVPPVTTALQVEAYLQRIREATERQFYPLMTLYLTDTLEPSVVRDVLGQKLAIGIKYYPTGKKGVQLTTNSTSGVSEARSLWTKDTKPYACLRELADYGGVLLLHAADGVNKHDEELDPYDQETHFLTVTLPNLVDAHPKLKISVEHLSTAKGAEDIRFYGRNSHGKIGCSLTAHHLLLDRRDVFRGGFHPHRHWWPIIQSAEHKQELRKLAAENHPFVWLGSDSAPHPVGKKETNCCIGGVLMAHAGIELYVEAFEDMKALDDRFERFASINGRQFFGVDAFYGLQPSDEILELVRDEWIVREPFFAQEAGVNEKIIPFRLGENIRWKLAA